MRKNNKDTATSATSLITATLAFTIHSVGAYGKSNPKKLNETSLHPGEETSSL